MDLEKQNQKAKGFIQEFKDFAMKGSVIDLAVGVVIGGAFGKIVDSLVADIIMPLVSGLIGTVNFENLTATIGQTELKYGLFINNIVQFLIISFALFLVIRQINKLRPDEEPAPVTTKQCEFCMSEVDLKASRCPHCTSELS